MAIRDRTLVVQGGVVLTERGRIRSPDSDHSLRSLTTCPAVFSTVLAREDQHVFNVGTQLPVMEVFLLPTKCYVCHALPLFVCQTINPSCVINTGTFEAEDSVYHQELCVFWHSRVMAEVTRTKCADGSSDRVLKDPHLSVDRLIIDISLVKPTKKSVKNNSLIT